jgi:hypothetical protein
MTRIFQGFQVQPLLELALNAARSQDRVGTPGSLLVSSIVSGQSLQTLLANVNVGSAELVSIFRYRANNATPWLLHLLSTLCLLDAISLGSNWLAHSKLQIVYLTKNFPPVLP